VLPGPPVELARMWEMAVASPLVAPLLAGAMPRRILRIYGVAGHMHLRGVDIKIELDGKTLLHIPHWSFHWQDAYYLDQPVDASPGDTLRVTCAFDNSPSHQPIVDGKPLQPRYVLWGEGTTDEMCLGLLQAAVR